MERNLGQDAEVENDINKSFWSQIEVQVTADLQMILAPRFKKLKKSYGDSTQEKIDEYCEEAMGSERQFVEKVLDKVALIKTKQKTDVRILFDIDETICRIRFGEDGNSYTQIIRPTFLPLLSEIIRQLDNKSVHFGILSSRSTDGVKSQLADPEQLQALQGMIELDQIYSSRRGGLGTSKEQKAFLESSDARRVIDSLALTDRYPKEEDDGPEGGPLKTLRGLVPDDFVKLSILAKLGNYFPDALFMAIDDLRYPSVLNESNGFYGVSLENGGRFSISV